MSIKNYKDILEKYKELRKIGPPQLVKKELIHPDSNQPRQDFYSKPIPKSTLQDLKHLASSIDKQGLINPIVIAVAYKDKKNQIHYIIVDGERRFRATTQQEFGGIGKKEILAQIIEIQDPIGLDLIRLSVQQTSKNWDPYDQAQAEKNLLDKVDGNISLVSQMIGVSRQAIINHQLIFELKPESLNKLKDEGKEYTYARESGKLLKTLNDNDKNKWPNFEEVLINKITTHHITKRDEISNLIKAFNIVGKGDPIKRLFFEDENYTAKEAIETAGIEWKNLAHEAKAKSLRLGILLTDHSSELEGSGVADLKRALKALRNRIDIFLS